MKKRLISLFLALLMTSCLLTFTATAQTAEEAATRLNKLGFLQGVGVTAGGQPDFELGRVPNRAECFTFMVRLVGYGDAVQTTDYPHPFTDVPDWASSYVGMAKTVGFTSGISATEFGSTNPINAQQFSTILLRVLGYKENADFTYDTATSDIVKLGVIPQSTMTEALQNFTRGDMAIFADALLKATPAWDTASYCQTLVDFGVISEAEATIAGYGVLAPRDGGVELVAPQPGAAPVTQTPAATETSPTLTTETTESNSDIPKFSSIDLTGRAGYYLEGFFIPATLPTLAADGTILNDPRIINLNRRYGCQSDEELAKVLAYLVKYLNSERWDNAVDYEALLQSPDFVIENWKKFSKIDPNPLRLVIDAAFNAPALDDTDLPPPPSSGMGNAHDCVTPKQKYRLTCGDTMQFRMAMMDILGIPNEAVVGTLKGGAHGWNRVYFEDQWWHYDNYGGRYFTDLTGTNLVYEYTFIKHVG